MKKNVFFIVIVIVILIAAGVLRLINDSEDAWVCEQGEWIEYGNPIEAKPDTLCAEETIDLEEEPVQKVEPLVGGDKDEHGCIGSAGYTWCEDKQKCLRVWEEACEITITEPQFDDLVISPLTVRGEAKGTWFFEAVIPIKLVDKDNNVILSSYGQTASDWMTEDFISFEAVLDFNTDATEGYLIIEKNNPSDSRDLDALFRVPVRFK